MQLFTRSNVRLPKTHDEHVHWQSDELLERPGIEPETPGLQGEWHNHCVKEASLKTSSRRAFIGMSQKQPIHVIKYPSSV